MKKVYIKKKADDTFTKYIAIRKSKYVQKQGIYKLVRVDKALIGKSWDTSKWARNIIDRLDILDDKTTDYIPTSNEAHDIIKSLFEGYKDET